MPYVAEMVTETISNPGQMISMALGGVALVGSLGTIVNKSFTRTPQNTAGMREHHGRPRAKKDSWRRRVRIPKLLPNGIPKGIKKGDLYGDVEPGSSVHLPFVRSIAHVGTHVRFSKLVDASEDNAKIVDNSKSKRQHALGGVVAWKVVDKYDDNHNLIAYERDGKPVAYMNLIHDAIYKARKRTPGEKQTDPEHALETMVISTAWTGLKELMQDTDDSHTMKSADALELLKPAVKEHLLGYATEIVGLQLGDTHLTDLMPHAVKSVFGQEAQAFAADGMAFQLGDARLRLVTDPPASS